MSATIDTVTVIDTAIDATEERRHELDALIKQHFGQNSAIARIEKLSERAAVVARLHLNNAPVPSVIAKFTRGAIQPSQPIDANKIEFAEEQLAHRFLATLHTPEKYKPDLLNTAPQGIILLQDLGPEGHNTKRTYDYLIPRLAEAIAHLHNPSRNQFENYCTLREEAGLGRPDDDRRRYGKPAYQALYQLGTEFILTRYETTTFRYYKSAVATELQQVDHLISNPGPFLAFIHDDLGNARQTFEVGDKLYLLDFEYSKYSHALLDFAKPLMGKFEINLETGAYGWTGPHFPLALIDHYRQYTETTLGVEYENHNWQEATAAAMTYAALTLIGRLCRLEPNRNLRGTVKQNIQAILKHLSMLLDTLQSLPATKGFINGYLTELT